MLIALGSVGASRGMGRAPRPRACRSRPLLAVRVAGYRVLMTPLARVRVAGTAAGERPTDRDRRPEPTVRGGSCRDHGDAQELRAPVAAWLVPAALLMGVIRIVYLSVARRFEEALDVVAAWWWNVAHLPRHGVAAAARAEGPAGRRSLAPTVHGVGRAAVARGSRPPNASWRSSARSTRRTRANRSSDGCGTGPHRCVGTHPVIVGTLLAIVVGAVAVRELVALDVLAGGALPAFPARAGDLFGGAGVRVPLDAAGGLARSLPGPRRAGRALGRGASATRRPCRRPSSSRDPRWRPS